MPSSRTSQPRWVSRTLAILRSTLPIHRVSTDPRVSESGSCVTITISPRMPCALATPPISIRAMGGLPAGALFENFDERALARARRNRLDDRAQRASGLAAAADDLAKVGLGDLELVDVGLPLLDQLDADFVR